MSTNKKKRLSRIQFEFKKVTTAYRKKQYKKCLMLLDRLDKIRPSNPRRKLWIRRGRIEVFLDLEKYKEACREFERLAPEDKTATTFNNEGYAYWQLEKLGKALKAYRKAVKINPSYHNAIWAIGGVLYDQGRLKEALPYVKKALSLASNYANAWGTLGDILSRYKDHKGAIRAFLKELRYRKDAIAFSRLGYAYFNIKKYERALKAFRTAIKLDPKDAQYQREAGETLVMLGRYGVAIRYLRRAVKFGPNYLQAWSCLGVALYYAGDSVEGRRAFEKALKIDKTERRSINFLGYIEKEARK